VPIVFWSFRVMVGIGLADAGLGVWSLIAALARQALHARRGCMRSAVVMGPSGLVAVLAGWITTEVGRQPYTVYGLLRTADSVSPIARRPWRFAGRVHRRLLRRVRGGVLSCCG
jgi:cytochrome bd ubiquinol oxidase subunit I